MARYRRFAVEELAAVRALETWMQIVDAPDAESGCRSCDILCTGMAVFRGTSNPQGCPVVCSHPAGLRLPCARLCAAQPSPPFFFVFPRCVHVLLSVARPGLDGNSA